MVVFFLNLVLLDNCQISGFFFFFWWGGFHSVMWLLGFTTYLMLHRYTEGFLVQPLLNLILKGNTIMVCSCPMSHVLVVKFSS